MHTTRLGAWEPGGTALATARGRATTRACQLQPPQWSSAQVGASPMKDVSAGPGEPFRFTSVTVSDHDSCYV